MASIHRQRPHDTFMEKPALQKTPSGKDTIIFQVAAVDYVVAWIHDPRWQVTA